MTAKQIIERILRGEHVPMCEIKERNAQLLMDWVRRGPHDADKCIKKHCVHGPCEDDVAHAATLMQEAGEICTCGNH